MNNLTPMLNELNRIYDALNEHYFENELPEVFITIYPGKKKTQSVYGMFSPESWAKADSIEQSEDGEDVIEKSDIHHEIAISAEYFTRPTANWVATMVHEMVHLYCHENEIEDTSNGGRYHNKRFKKEAEKRGLVIDKADIIGWSVTSPTTELIQFVEELKINEEAFKYFRDTRFAESAPSVKKRYICPLCGLQIQAKKGKNIICGDCQCAFDYWDITDPDEPEILEDNNDGLAMSADGWFNNMEDE